MRCFTILACLFFSLLAVAATPPDKPNTVLIHAGEVLYAVFDEANTGLKLVSTSKEKNDKAQLIITMARFDGEHKLQVLEVKSAFKKNLKYKAEMRLLSRNRRQETSVIPVRGGLSSFESWPHPIEELALYGFALDP